jgi:hypothetical protein
MVSFSMEADLPPMSYNTADTYKRFYCEVSHHVELR